MSIHSRPQPAPAGTGSAEHRGLANILLQRAHIAASGWPGRPALVRLAEQLPAVAMELCPAPACSLVRKLTQAHGSKVRLKAVFDILQDRYSATGVAGSEDMQDLRRTIAVLMTTSRLRPYLDSYDPRGVPIALPFRCSGGGRRGSPFVLERMTAEETEYLLNAEVAYQQAEADRRDFIQSRPNWHLPPLRFSSTTTVSPFIEEEDY
jgi:hypothetical protein